MRVLLLVAVGACGTSAKASVDATAMTPDVAGFDVVVSSTGVVVWAGLTGQLANNGRFAAPGTCGGSTDAFINAPSCFGGVDIDGMSLDSGSGGFGPANPYEFRRAIAQGSTFTARDCGVEISVPLHAGPFPRATSAQAARVGADIIVSWTANADFTIASLDSTLDVVDCNDAGVTQHVFAFANSNNAPFTAAVQPLTTPEITNTALGAVRVWYGDRTEFGVPAP